MQPITRSASGFNACFNACFKAVFSGVLARAAPAMSACLLALALLMALLMAGWTGGQAEEAADPASEEAAEPDQDEEESGIGFPSDRLRERQLDRARRLVADERWSDAATLFDEILAADRDFFFRPDQQQRTWQSIKSEANRLIGGLGKPGREAYELQFRARADRMLAQAVATNDMAGIVAVARRWFHTPAGYRATLLAALEALEASQPLAAAAWLDRLASADGAQAFEPSLSVMRAIAWMRAGDRPAADAILERARAGGRNVARIGAKDVTVSFPAGGGLAWLEAIVGATVRRPGSHGGEWAMHRGDPARNRISMGSCPLLVPRYRVPLARHPEESRLLEARRRLAADQEIALLPAGTPLAIDGTILLHTTMGLLAVDFETGKRIWLQTGAGAAPLAAAPGEVGELEGADGAGDAGSLSSVFDDATSGTMASDGRLVFVVESHPDSRSSQPAVAMNFRPGGLQATGGWKGGNSLSAYDIANRGALRWRLPIRGVVGDEGGRQAAGTAWYLGPPMPVGEQLLVLVEEKGEIRLDVLAAGTGRTEWSQPLAEVDEERAIDNRDGHARRLAGLSPALAEGVLVCPTGAGAVVAVDLATRTLLWAHDYPQAKQKDAIMLPNGIRVRAGVGPGAAFAGNGGGGLEPSAGRWIDSTPILAGGRVLLTQGESQELHCLDLRQGTTVWRLPRKDRLYVAGVIDGHAIVVGRRGVESLDMANGRMAWQRPLGGDHGNPSGRGILVAQRLFLPLDTPEVLEIDLADGRIVGRSAARGNTVPGNLLAYRGEVISQSVDSLDVFHQSAPLESRLETALRTDARDPWALLWRGQLDLDRGDVASGIAMVRAAHAARPDRVPANVVADALLFALRSDFAKAAPVWRDVVAMSSSPLTVAVALRTSVDGFLRTGDLPQAWEAMQQLLATSNWRRDAQDRSAPDLETAADPLVADGTDPALSLTPSRWEQGRLADLLAKAPPAVRAEIEAFSSREAAAALASISSAPAGIGRVEKLAILRRFIERFGLQEPALLVRRQLAEALGEAIEAGVGDDEGNDLLVERDFVLLDLARVGLPADREHAVAVLDSIRGGLTGAAVNMGGNEADAWPIGKVVQRRGSGLAAGSARQGEAGEELRIARTRLMNIHMLEGPDSFLPGLELAFDLNQQTGIIATDGYGRSIGDPFGMKSRSGSARLMPMFQAGGTDEATVIGRVVFLRAGGTIGAFEMAGHGQPVPGKVGRGRAGQGSRNRNLWMLGDRHDPSADLRAAGFQFNAGGGRIARDGTIPLGAKVSEPRNAGEAGRRGGVQWGRARCTGVPLLVDRSLKVYEPRTGAVIWERQRLPAASELICDDEFLCVCPADGRQAIVLAMADGRVVRTLDIPRSEQRLLASGRRILAVQPAPERADRGQGGQPSPGADSAASASAGRGRGSRVRLELIDTVDDSRQSLGDYPGESRAAAAGPGRLAVVEPSGALTLLDIDAGRVAFRVQLSDMPSGLEQVQVMPWMDRYLVLVGRAETPEEQEDCKRIGTIGTMPAWPGREMPQLITGSLWAVDRSNGDMLWPVPATILRHSLQRHEASQLPMLLFTRSIQARSEPESPRLSVLCLDKRTGQAIYLDDRFNSRSLTRPDVGMLGCGIVGDPATHTIRLVQGRREAGELELEFTGGPAAPRPPFQAAAARPSGGASSVLDIEYWINKALAIPLPPF